MRRMRSLRALLTAAAVAMAGAGLTALGAGPAQAATPLPDHVFAPYFEAWTGDSPAALSAESGAKHLTMAFIQTPSPGSCTPYWNGDSGSPISSGTFGSDIKTMQARGGDVIPSFGGYTADTTGTEIADSCTDVGKIAAAYEKVVTTYDVARLDMDIEVDSLGNTAGIDRRNKAIKQVEDWAAANGRKLQISYTLPTTTSGLASDSLAVLRSAVQNGARVDVANIMTFDYYDGADPHDMARDTQTAAQGLHDQLASLYPGKADAELWGMVGVTEMPGVDDYGTAETFTLADASKVYTWAKSKGIDTIAFWALQRDNGSCPGGGAGDGCSGIEQGTWAFSHIFAPFTSGGTTTPPPNGGQCDADPWDTGAVYTGGDQVSYGGHLWQAKWWTTGEEPGTTGEWGVWQDLGAC